MGSMELEFEGHVYFIEKDDNGNIIRKDEIEQEFVVNCLLSAIREGVKHISVKEEEQYPKNENEW